MKYIDEFRNSKIAIKISRVIFEQASNLGCVNIMEVCGTHTMSICKFGIRDMVPQNINLISGPGCPVCVTPRSYIDRAIALSKLPGITITTFGDMMKVPGSYSSLLQERSDGREIIVVYSPLDAMDIAERWPEKNIIFLGIGFETTAPAVAATLIEAKRRKLKNFFVLSGHKIMPPVMEVLAGDPEINIDGFLCPAHVSTIIGIKPYKLIADRYRIPCVIAGFEPIDILQGILMLIKQIKSKKAGVENQYSRVVRKSGNKKARRLLEKVFLKVESEWRGIGVVPESGLMLNKRFAHLDAEGSFSVPRVSTKSEKGCICGSILKGTRTPFECKLFAKACTPANPVGACMVSSEGTCAAYYRYRR